MSEPQEPTRFSYADYEQAIRAPNAEAMRRSSQQTAVLFRGCRHVLDVASGQGLLMEALREAAIPALGVDSEPTLVRNCRANGLDVVEDDALRFLKTTDARFDGLHCAHLIEHLPPDPFLDFVEGAHRVLSPGGLLLVLWPNSRSAAVQMLSFWRDPTHVRFYDGDFVAAVLRFYGFEIVRTQYAEVSARSLLSDLTPEDLRPADSTPRGRGPRPSLLPLAARVFRWSKNGALRQTRAARRLVALGETVLLRRHRDSLARQVFGVPGEAIIIARRGAS